ncbi:HlyD family efflux transporter periplasmic adaptor subunit [Gymnodinialimonas sp. 2305UL16-5]|uniref:HlyD family efflux transporter periplasmic adaptor subunit n=1 Tax=Gymnodinialimonas mytili TaxID=3126503 RepID=UPI0030B7F161
MDRAFPDNFPLPALREDLRIERAAPLASGAAAWVIYDPARHRYFQIGQRALDILAAWRADTLEHLIERLKTQSGLIVDKPELSRLLKFLYANELTQAPMSGRSSDLSDRARMARRAGILQMMKAYLFFRVHLVRPGRFLDATLPIAELFFSRLSVICAVLCGVVGLSLVLRQADRFIAYAQQFYSPEGAIAIGLTLIFVKVLHELGHAYQARRRGVAVPSMGVAFMVMMPLLYTEVSDAWRLRDRRGKLMIDAGGVLVELWLAAIATLAWVFLPDGTARIGAFSIATTSWIMSLFVNLNPFMRFDGYYFLNDALGTQNLQPRAFAMARWRLRELLFDLRDDPPELYSTRMRRFLVVYAWLTWIYRFFLFLGIALLVYQLFFKALGIALFLIEIVFFIILPVYKEIVAWAGMRQRISRRPRAWLTAGLLMAGIVLLLVPLPVKVRAPAMMGFAEMVEIYPTRAGQILDLHAEQGRAVERGEVLAILSSPELENDRQQTALRITLLQRRLDRTVASRGDLTERRIIERELETERERLAGLVAEINALAIVAPINGVAVDLSGPIRAGGWVSRRDRIATIATPGPALARGYVAEADLDRIDLGAEGVFVPDDPAIPSARALLSEVAAYSSAQISQLELAADAGGRIPVESAEEPGDAPRPNGAWFFLTADLPGTELPSDAQAIRGVVVFEGRAESLARRMVLQVARVLIRETNL